MHKFGVNFKIIDEDKEWFFCFLKTEMLRLKGYIQDKRWNECNRSVKMLSSLSTFLNLDPLHQRLIKIASDLESSPEKAIKHFEDAYNFVGKLPVLNSMESQEKDEELTVDTAPLSP